MNKYTEKEIQFIKDNYGVLRYQQMATALNRSLTSVKAKARSVVPYINKQGGSNFSRKKRENNLDDNFFKNQTESSCYWAGFIAADGFIGKGPTRNMLKIHLSSKDKGHLESFKKDIDFDGDIKVGLDKYKYKGIYSYKEYCLIQLFSQNIVLDLKNNFNIENAKSLTLKPPFLSNKVSIDCFICGYIDGDGSIGLRKTKRGVAISIEMLATLEIANWIQDRFSEILNERLNCIYKRGKKDKNSYRFVVSARRARTIFLHYQSLKCPKLNRKWSQEAKDHCENYKKYKNKERYLEIAKMKLRNFKIPEIAKILGITDNAVRWYFKQPIMKEIESYVDTEESA